MVITFIDYVAAFDTVSHKFLESALEAAGTSSKVKSIFRAIYRTAPARVRVRRLLDELETVHWSDGCLR